MPLYEFRCGRCGEEFEKILSSSAGRVTCPSCRSRKTEKLFSAFGMKSGGKFVSSRGSAECGSCTSKNCKSCG
ncbi:zinc ribbon domain-containing protein [Candidatus Moduliflexota bacterium]